MAVYIFKEGEIIALKNAKSANPQAIGEELDRIRLARGGELMPGAVLEAAREADNPLHAFFEWRRGNHWRLEHHHSHWNGSGAGFHGIS